MIQAQNIAISRAGQFLFQQLHFEVQAGEILHIEGENGSGKSTLLRILLGLTMPDCGTVLWQNQPISRVAHQFKQNLCYIGHANAIKEEFTALENLNMMAQLAGFSLSLERALHALKLLQLTHRAHLPAKFLSQGQKRRIALSRLFFDSRALWILDEPFVALDSSAILCLVEHMNAHLDNRGAIIFTSHQPIEGISHPMKRLRLESNVFPR